MAHDREKVRENSSRIITDSSINVHKRKIKVDRRRTHTDSPTALTNAKSYFSSRQFSLVLSICRFVQPDLWCHCSHLNPGKEGD